MANPLIGSDSSETVKSVHNVLEFMAWHRPIGEETPEIQDGRRLILQACTEALEEVMQARQ